MGKNMSRKTGRYIIRNHSGNIGIDIMVLRLVEKMVESLVEKLVETIVEALLEVLL